MDKKGWKKRSCLLEKDKDGKIENDRRYLKKLEQEAHVK